MYLNITDQHVDYLAAGLARHLLAVLLPVDILALVLVLGLALLLVLRLTLGLGLVLVLVVVLGLALVLVLGLALLLVLGLALLLIDGAALLGVVRLALLLGAAAVPVGLGHSLEATLGCTCHLGSVAVSSSVALGLGLASGET